MKEIIRYQTTDGKVFDEIEEARMHQAKLDLYNTIETELFRDSEPYDVIDLLFKRFKMEDLKPR
ncbi:hypothetical protein ACI2KR_27085 [Pseudomonas luteola]